MKKILFTQRLSKNQYGSDINVFESAYADYFQKYNIVITIIPNEIINVDDFCDNHQIDGIVFTGGEDIGIKKQSKRDILEKKLLIYAIKNKIPVLGICRGMQFINLFFGGKLISIKEIDKKNIHNTPQPHKIKIFKKKIINTLNNSIFKINSYHNQAVLLNNLGNDLEYFALFEELKLVEALKHINYPIAGIQWHPERPNSDKKFDDYIINAFLNNKLFWKKQ